MTGSHWQDDFDLAREAAEDRRLSEPDASEMLRLSAALEAWETERASLPVGTRIASGG